MTTEGPRAVCVCGHTGMGVDSDHDILFVLDEDRNIVGTESGMGECTRCMCTGFRFKEVIGDVSADGCTTGSNRGYTNGIHTVEEEEVK